jgi:hypothetical protein
MASVPPPVAVLLLFSGWVNRHQQAIIDYLVEENRVLRAAIGSDDCTSPTTSDAVSP